MVNRYADVRSNQIAAQISDNPVSGASAGLLRRQSQYLQHEIDTMKRLENARAAAREHAQQLEDAEKAELEELEHELKQVRLSVDDDMHNLNKASLCAHVCLSWSDLSYTHKKNSREASITSLPKLIIVASFLVFSLHRFWYIVLNVCVCVGCWGAGNRKIA